MKECVDSLKNDNPEFKFYLFDDNDCREFIKQNFENKVLDAFDTLIPGAYKADLWRYCILYKLGGIYLDIKYRCVKGFKLITLMNEEHFVRDMFHDDNSLSVYNAFMVCKPNNIIMLQCINKIVENVTNRYYGNSPLSVTGPRMMIGLFSPSYKRQLNEMYHTDDNDNNYYIVYKSCYILMIYPEYRREQDNYKNKAHYGISWSQKEIYNIAN
jgi:mannosyltransferase OCH1-like enzyme